MRSPFTGSWPTKEDSSALTARDPRQVQPEAIRARVVLPASTCAKIPKLSVLRSKRHTLRTGHEALFDGDERSAHLRSLGRSALSK
jgi:hypothetical protein